MSKFLFPGFLCFLAVLAWYLAAEWSFPVKSPAELADSYDFIVVGAGSGGAVVAARLSEDPQQSVLLIEAGTEGWAAPWSHIPGLVPLNQLGSIDWQYKTVPQENACLGLENKQSRWPRGKVLGGTSVLNTMVHHRGNPADYDRWAKELGCPGWSYKDVLPYFKKLENAQLETPNPDLRGDSGNIVVTKTTMDTAIGRAFMAGAKERGHPYTMDYIGEQQEGFSRYQQSISNGKRQSTFESYLKPTRDRTNLHILTAAHVTKILFNDEKRAVGVEYLHGDKKHQVRVKREVVLSAGAVGSPQLLMLSGVGPKDHLDHFGIKVVADSPAVGEHLQDHIMSFLLFKINQSAGVDFHELFSLETLWRAYEYIYHGTGPWATPGVEIQGILRSGVGPNSSSIPDLQICFNPLIATADLGPLFNYLPETERLERANMDTPSTFHLMCCCQRPRSRGQIRLQSADPLVHPFIDPRYLQDPYDLKVAIKALQIALDIVQKSKSMQKFGPEWAEEALPACRQHQRWSEAFLECVVRHKTMTIYHPTSTCRMGPDPRTDVLDPGLRVRGVSGLRVADASAFPEIPSGNTNIPVIMLAEKAADIIKEDHRIV